MTELLDRSPVSLSRVFLALLINLAVRDLHLFPEVFGLLCLDLDLRPEMLSLLVCYHRLTFSGDSSPIGKIASTKNCYSSDSSHERLDPEAVWMVSRIARDVWCWHTWIAYIGDPPQPVGKPTKNEHSDPHVSQKGAGPLSSSIPRA